MHIYVLMASELGHLVVSVVDDVFISERVCESEIDWVSNFDTWCVLGIACGACELMTER